MLLNGLMLLSIVPATLIVLAGNWFNSIASSRDQSRIWVKILMVSMIVMLIPVSLLSRKFFTGEEGLFLILIFPALAGITALLAIHWRALTAFWQEEKAQASSMLVVLCVLWSIGAWGNLMLLVALTLSGLIVALVWQLGRRLGFSALVTSSLIVLVFLLLDATGLAGNHYVHTTSSLWTIYKMGSGIAAVLGLLLAALLSARILEEVQGGKKFQSFFPLSIAILLLLSVFLNVLRYAVLVKATARATEDHIPFGVFAAALVAGLLLAIGAQKVHLFSGLVFTITVGTLIACAYAVGWLFDPQGVTAVRAERLARAVDRYYQDTGEYPPNLEALMPHYQLVILGPLTGRGQAWCYQGGPDYYRLGYVVFQRYYDATYPQPYYEIKVIGSAGKTTAGPWACDAELSRFKETGGL